MQVHSAFSLSHQAGDLELSTTGRGSRKDTGTTVWHRTMAIPLAREQRANGGVGKLNAGKEDISWLGEMKDEGPGHRWQQ